MNDEISPVDPKAFGLQGKTAIVTGGSRGIGRSLVLALAAGGANVVIASRNIESCEAVAGEAREFGVEALAVSTHVGKWSALEALADAAFERFGSVEILVNNAGMAPTPPSMVGITEELFDKTVAVNLKGPLRLSTLVGSRMVAGGGGSIINISSMSAFKPRPATAVYAASKAALNVLTVALAQEYAPTVRVNAIGVGPTRTDISASWIDSPEFTLKAQESIGLQRVATPREYVGTVLYLASDASSYTTGAMIQVDGGSRF